MGKRRMVSAVAAEKSDEDEINGKVLHGVESSAVSLMPFFVDDSTKNDSDIESEEDAETADQETDEEDSMEVDEDDQVDDEEEATSEHSDDAEESIGKSRGTALKDAALDVEANVRKSGVIYLSSIPPGMNVAKLRDIMSQYGALGRIYLEPDLKGGRSLISFPFIFCISGDRPMGNFGNLLLLKDAWRKGRQPTRKSTGKSISRAGLSSKRNGSPNRSRRAWITRKWEENAVRHTTSPCGISNTWTG